MYTVCVTPFEKYGNERSKIPGEPDDYRQKLFKLIVLKKVDDDMIMHFDLYEVAGQSSTQTASQSTNSGSQLTQRTRSMGQIRDMEGPVPRMLLDHQPDNDSQMSPQDYNAPLIVRQLSDVMRDEATNIRMSVRDQVSIGQKEVYLFCFFIFARPVGEIFCSTKARGA